MVGILRLCGGCATLGAAALRMTLFMVVLMSATAWGTTYYVSSSSGSDTNSGTSANAAWATLAYVNAQTFNPGDSILFKRGDVWNESLAPPSSGTSGNPIAFDAYGVGPAPNFTGWYAMPTAASAWTSVGTNAWKAQLPNTFTAISFCLFGSVWGQKVTASTANLTAQWDFYLANGYLYVYSVGNPATNSSLLPIVAMALTNTPVINVNGKSWLTFQHILVNWFDDIGVYVQGTSDHLVFANMEADSMIPQGAQPLGFDINESTPGPGDIKIYNSEAHLNYDGFRFDGSATAITMVNDKGYGNRDGALVDNTSAVNYSYCHFYASSLAVAGSTDVEYTAGTGPIAGAGNIAADTPAAVQVWQRYPAEITLTVDDIGMTPGADTYYAQQVLPVAQAAAVPVGVAVTVGYGGTINPIISEIQGWINQGIDVTTHSVSHTYYVNTNAFTVQYTGSGTAAALTIGGTPPTLTITVTGANDSFSCSLAQASVPTWAATQCGTIQELMSALTGTGKFTATLPPLPCQGPYGTGCSTMTNAALLSQDLASVMGQDVKTNPYMLLLSATQLQNDEITLSRQWMQSNLTGLPAAPVYVYPGGYETPTMQGIAAGVPYTGARGALKEDLGVKDTYASGFDVQNVTSFGVNPSWMGSQGAGVTPTQLNQKIQALVWKEQVWGVPWGIFWHNNELVQNDPVGGTEITNLIQDFQNAGATVQTNTSLVKWLTTGTLATGTGATDGNFYYKIPAAKAYTPNGGLDFRPTAASPVVDAGENLGAAYAIDINGVNQNSYGSGWEIGAHVYVPQTVYGTGTSSTAAGATGDGAVDVVAAPSLGGLVSNNALVTDTMVTGAKMFRLTDTMTQTGTNSNFAYSVPCGGSADNNMASELDDFFLIEDAGNNHFIRYLNASGSNSLPLYANLDPAKGNLTVNCGEFSYTNDLLFYDHGSAASPQVTQYNLSGYNIPSIANPSALPTQAVIANFAPVIGGTVTWQTLGGMDANDNVNSLSFHVVQAYSTTAGQNTGCIAAAVVANAVNPTLASDVYYVYNTCTGVVTEYQNCSATSCGTVTTIGTVAVDDRFCIHNFKYHGGAYATITAGANGCSYTIPGNDAGYYFWQLGTANVLPCVACAGHETEYPDYFVWDAFPAGQGYNFGSLAYDSVAAGIVNVSGNTMTFVSGIPPNSSMTGNIAICPTATACGGSGPSVSYTISSCNASSCTLTSSPGTLTGVRYNYPPATVQNGGSLPNGELLTYPSLWPLAVCSGSSFPYTNEPCMKFPFDNHISSNTNQAQTDNSVAFYATTSYGNKNFPRSLGVVNVSSGAVSLLYGGQFASSWSGHNIIISGQNCTFTYSSTTTGSLSGGSGCASMTGSSLPYMFVLFPGCCYDEIDAFSSGGTVRPFGYNYRIAYSYNSTFNPSFNIQNSIGAVNQSGNYFLVSTDWQCTLGTSNGTATSYCAPDWPTSTGIAAGAMLSPQLGNSGKYVFMTSSGCTTGTTEPNPWPQTMQATQTDGTCTWTNIGSYRGDVVAVEMPSAQRHSTLGLGSPGMKIEIIAPSAGITAPDVNTYLKPSPYINAIVYSLWWSCSDQDGTAAHYTWTNFDNQIASDGWPAAGKKIIIVMGGVTYGGTDNVCYGGGGWGATGIGNYGTPTYVWTALGASNAATCSSSGGTQQIPNYLNSAYLNNYQNWVAATLAHFASASYAPSIQYIRIAWGKGGETTPIANWAASGTCPDGNGNNTLTTDWGYTLTGWENFLQNGMTYEVSLGFPFQLMISITPMGPNGGSQATVPNFTAPIAASLHIGFGTQGLMASDVNNVPGCGGNWCNLFATYTGQVPLETQTYYQSCASTNEDGTCPSMAVTTGPLDPLLAWAAENHTTTFEMYYEDACSMLCPGYGVSGYAAYPQPGYLTALENVVGGNE